MSFTDTSSEWIWAYKSGSSVSSDNVNVALPQHSKYGTTTLNLQNAAGGGSINPFAGILSASSLSSSTSSSTGEGSGSSDGESDDTQTDYYSTRMVHAIISTVAFALLFPLGSMGIRSLNIRNLVWIHAGWMVFTYLFALAGMGLGIWIVLEKEKLDSYHAIIELIVIGALLLQPITGLTHHLLFKRWGRVNAATYPHVWWGRTFITLGIINSGFGLQLSYSNTPYEIVYGVGAGIVWCLWIAVILVAFVRSRARREGDAGAVVFGRDGEKQNSSFEIMRQEESSRNSPMRRSYVSSDEVARQTTRTARYV